MSYIVTADIVLGCQLLENPPLQEDYDDAELWYAEPDYFYSNLSRVGENEVMWTRLSYDQALAIHTEYGIEGFTPMEEEEEEEE